MKPYITCDLDSTVCDTTQRHHLVDRVNGTDWVNYSLHCKDDEPFEAVVSMLTWLQLSLDIVFVSGRNEEAREQTLIWLRNQGIHVSGLFLDSGKWDQEYPTHAHYKLATIQRVEALRGQRAQFHIDDLPNVANVLRESGRPCLVVDPMYPNSSKEYIL